MTHDHRTMIGGPQDCECVVVSIAAKGAFLAMRETAATIRGYASADLNDGRTVVLDFTDVQAITGAFADELVAKLHADHGDRVRWEGANPEVLDAIQTAIARRTTAPSAPNPRT